MDFLNVASDVVVEKEVDRLGGFQVYNADLYAATIMAAFLDKSASGANNITILLENGDGFKFTSTEYITSRAGTNTYVCKKTSKKKLLPGMAKMNGLAELLTGKKLANSVIEERVHKIYSKDSGAEVPQPRPTLIEWTGLSVHVGMLKILENKREKVGEEYIAVADTRESNEIDKWFNEKKATLSELQAGTEPKFHADWVAKNKDDVRDKTNKNLAKVGAPAMGGAPTPTTTLNFS